MKKQVRNNEIDFWRFIFAIIIMLHHSYQLSSSGGEHVVFASGALAVDAFFILSGYFMTSYVYNNDQALDTQKYLVKRYSKLFPWVLFSFLIGLFIELIFNQDINLLSVICRSVFELSFTFMIGMKGSSINALTWYLSAMILAEMIIYPILKSKKKIWYSAIAPIVCLLILGNLSYNFGCIGNTYTWKGIAYVGLWRAIMGISCGCACSGLVHHISENYNFSKFGILFLKIIKWCSMLVCLIYMFKCNQGVGDFTIFVLFAVWCVTVETIRLSSKVENKNSKFKEKAGLFFNRFSLLIYLNQYAALKILGYINLDVTFAVELFLYIGITISLSVVANLIVPLTIRACRGLFSLIAIKKEEKPK